MGEKVKGWKGGKGGRGEKGKNADGTSAYPVGGKNQIVVALLRRAMLAFPRCRKAALGSLNGVYRLLRHHRFRPDQRVVYRLPPHDDGVAVAHG